MEEILNYIEERLQRARKENVDWSDSSWGAQEGIVLSCNEAEILLNALRVIQEPSDSNYTNDYLDWRNRYFVRETHIKQWKSLPTSTRYTTTELHKRYEKAMLESPFFNA